MTTWYVQSGPECDVVVSSRIRLARNFKDISFPLRMSREQGKQVIDTAKSILSSDKESGRQFRYLEMEGMDPIEKQVMVEKHLMSPEMLQNVHSRGVLLSDDETISIMLNEEDHMRMQCLYPGLQLDEAWHVANTMDNILEEKIAYAYSERYGYLTSCPTNVGTGLRASAMLHLPGLTISGYLNSLLTAVNKIGIAIRGVYGEGTEARGHMFQISNQVTLGMSEEETLENIKGILNQIMKQERIARQKLMQESSVKLEDKIYRSYGVLTNARIISFEEFMKLLSEVRLGVNLGIIQDMDIKIINELMIATQPANIMKKFNAALDAKQRDIKRAELIRTRLGS